MLRLRAVLALTASLAIAAAIPAGCGGNNNSTGGGGSGGSGGSTTSSTTNSTTTDTTTSSGTGNGCMMPDGGDTSVACASCLDMICSTELAACDSDCIALQACLDTVCFNLSATASADEGACQVHCQDLHPASKQLHLDVVNCAQGGKSQPPCAGYSYDYDKCKAREDGGNCASKLMACTNSNDCLNYKACASTCKTLTDCLACGNTASGMAGLMIYADYYSCIETTCLAEGWLPNF